MNNPKSTIIGCVILMSMMLASCNRSKDSQAETVSKEAFDKLLNTVSEGWNSNNARLAADCFTEDAVYIEPPDQQLYSGRDELFEFFGGEEGRVDPMNMTWHYIVYDESQQIGTAEYTFKYKGRSTHGIVIVQVSEGKIRRWREYQYRSTTEWKDFIGTSKF